MPNSGWSGLVFSAMGSPLDGAPSAMVGSIVAASRDDESRRIRVETAAATDLRRAALDQVPSVAAEIEEHRDGAVALLARCLEERHAVRQHAVVVAPEVLGLEE